MRCRTLSGNKKVLNGASRFRAGYRKRLSAPCCLSPDLIADQAADRGAADHADRAAARKDRAADRAYAGADRGVFVPYKP